MLKRSLIVVSADDQLLLLMLMKIYYVIFVWAWQFVISVVVVVIMVQILFEVGVILDGHRVRKVLLRKQSWLWIYF